MGKEVKKEICLDNLPKHQNGRYKGKINWEQCEKNKPKVKFIYDNIEDELEIIRYNKETNVLDIIYNNLPFNITRNNFIKCRLGNILGKFTNEFKIKIGDIFKDNKKNIIIIDREYRPRKTKTGIIKDKYYKYHCNICGYEGWIVESNLFQNKGCSCCGINSKVIIEGINDIPTTAPWMIPYFQGGYDEAKLYTAHSSQDIIPKCPDCGTIKNKSMVISDMYRYHSMGCQYCDDGKSYNEKFLTNLFEQLKIEFETEYMPEWIKPKKYDFYFEANNKKYIVEADGYFHKNDNKMNDQTKEESKAIDDYKDEMAEKHNIEVIRIDCEESGFEYIKNNIFKSKLNNLFNLNEINWLKCEEFAVNTLVKKVCELKRDNPDLTTKDLTNLIKLKRSTIINYLKKGSKIWDWVGYNPSEEKRKSNSKNGKANGKQVEIFKDGISLDIFESCYELERQSEELFGVKLNKSNISAVCRSKRPHHKGFFFKYINK